MSRNHRRIPAAVWQRFRVKILKRDNWTCRECGGYGNEVDHIQPLHKGGAPLDAGNAQTLCRSCHLSKTSSENIRTPGRREWLEFVNELRSGR